MEEFSLKNTNRVTHTLVLKRRSVSPSLHCSQLPGLEGYSASGGGGGGDRGGGGGRM